MQNVPDLCCKFTPMPPAPCPLLLADMVEMLAKIIAALDGVVYDNRCQVCATCIG